MIPTLMISFPSPVIEARDPVMSPSAGDVKRSIARVREALTRF